MDDLSKENGMGLSGQSKYVTAMSQRKVDALILWAEGFQTEVIVLNHR